MAVHLLTRLDTRDIPDAPGEIRQFSVVKNEMARLPYFIDYHRRLGINRFFFIDNNSTDGSREFLLEQPDCHVFLTKNSYAESTYGIDWSNTLLDLYGTGHWCFIGDADELLVYPNCETIKLRQFCDFLDQEGSETVYTFMLDMYPSGSLADAKCGELKPFEQICPYFDRDYAFVDRLHLSRTIPFPRQEVIGGPRTRCFYGDQGAHNFAWRFFMHVLERGTVFLHRLHIPFPMIRLKATPLFKVPLIKWKKGLAYTASTHTIQPVKVSSVSGVLLHFKFFSDFHDKVMEAINSGEHAQGSIEYKRYHERMEAVGNLMYEGSLKYESSADVLNAKLMHSSPAYDTFVSTQKTASAA